MKANTDSLVIVFTSRPKLKKLLVSERVASDFLDDPFTNLTPVNKFVVVTADTIQAVEQLGTMEGLHMVLVYDFIENPQELTNVLNINQAKNVCVLYHDDSSVIAQVSLRNSVEMLNRKYIPLPGHHERSSGTEHLRYLDACKYLNAVKEKLPTVETFWKKLLSHWSAIITESECLESKLKQLPKNKK